VDVSDLATLRTVSAVNADDPATLQTDPAVPLSGKKTRQTAGCDVSQVGDHAESVVCLVAMIQLLKPSAGETGALEAVSIVVALEFIAVADDTADTVAGLVPVPHPTAGAAVLRSEKTHARSAVDSARSNMVLLKGDFLHYDTPVHTVRAAKRRRRSSPGCPSLRKKRGLQPPEDFPGGTARRGRPGARPFVRTRKRMAIRSDRCASEGGID